MGGGCSLSPPLFLSLSLSLLSLSLSGYAIMLIYKAPD